MLVIIEMRGANKETKNKQVMKQKNKGKTIFKNLVKILGEIGKDQIGHILLNALNED